MGKGGIKRKEETREKKKKEERQIKIIQPPQIELKMRTIGRL